MTDEITFGLSDDGDAVLLNDGTGTRRIVAVNAHHPIVPSYAFFLARAVFTRPAEVVEDLARCSYELQQDPGRIDYLPWDDPDLNGATREVYRKDVAFTLVALVERVLQDAAEEQQR